MSRTKKTNEMTADELSEELGALISVDESEIDISVLSNLTKAKEKNPRRVNVISTSLDKIVEQLKKIEQELSELSIESNVQFHLTNLQRLNHVFKFSAPIVGDREISQVSDDDFIKIGKASVDFRKEFEKKVPLSVIYPGKVEGKTYIIIAVNLVKGTPVYNMPKEYKGFPLLIDYGTFKPSSSNDAYREYQSLKPGISIGNAEAHNAGSLGALVNEKGNPDKKYLLTVKHAVEDVDSSVLQPGKCTSEDHCANVKYQNLSVDESGNLLDYAFCKIDKCCGSSIANCPCETRITINDIQSTMDSGTGCKSHDCTISDCGYQLQNLRLRK